MVLVVENETEVVTIQKSDKKTSVTDIKSVSYILSVSVIRNECNEYVSEHYSSPPSVPYLFLFRYWELWYLKLIKCVHFERFVHTTIKSPVVMNLGFRKEGILFIPFTFIGPK